MPSARRIVIFHNGSRIFKNSPAPRKKRHTLPAPCLFDRTPRSDTSSCLCSHMRDACAASTLLTCSNRFPNPSFLSYASTDSSTPTTLGPAFFRPMHFDTSFIFSCISLDTRLDWRPPRSSFPKEAPTNSLGFTPCRRRAFAHHVVSLNDTRIFIRAQVELRRNNFTLHCVRCQLSQADQIPCNASQRLFLSYQFPACCFAAHTPAPHRQQTTSKHETRTRER